MIFKVQRTSLFLLIILITVISSQVSAQVIEIDQVPAPLFRDPIFDGAADPSAIWNEETQEWWIFYTQRRANVPSQGVAYCYGSQIGIAVSSDSGRSWHYKGICQGLDIEAGSLTYWAPEVVKGDSLYHMYVTLIRGIYHDWGGKRNIVHLTSPDLFQWNFESQLVLTSDRVIDPGVMLLANGKWRLWYKDEAAGSVTKAAESDDLFNWELIAESSATDRSHEAPNVFFWKENFWLLTDTGQGLGVYKSTNGDEWEPQDMLMVNPGQRKDDAWFGQHPDIVIIDDRAYMFYFVHAGRVLFDKPAFNYTSTVPYEWKRTSLQLAELEIRDGKLICDRNKYLIEN